MPDRITPSEMSALALIASSKNCRMETRQEILDSLTGDAKLIGTAILHGPQEGIGMTQVHRAAAAQLKDWAEKLEQRQKRRAGMGDVRGRSLVGGAIDDHQPALQLEPDLTDEEWDLIREGVEVMFRRSMRDGLLDKERALARLREKIRSPR